MSAYGIHAHERFKLGRRPPKRAAALRASRILTGVTPKTPVSEDHFGSIQFGLDENDRFGVCGPTGFDNLVRLLTTGLTGKTESLTQDQVFAIYRLLNPGFDPDTGADDNGVDLQSMLEAVHTTPPKDVPRPIAFAALDVRNDKELDLATAVFGGQLWGVDLQTSQQEQSGLKSPKWDYHAPHSLWGGHCVMQGKYSGTTDDVISWEMDVEVTRPFRRHQLSEAWLVIFEWHLEDPAFLAGVNLDALKADYLALTGNELPVAKSKLKKADKEAEEVQAEAGTEVEA